MPAGAWITIVVLAGSLAAALALLTITTSQSLRSRIRVRIGVHEGTVIARDGDYFGQTVAIAARVAARAAGGEILVTQPVADDVTAYGRFRLSGGEPAELRGVPGEHALWRVGRRRG